MKPVFEAIAAHVDGAPCVAWLGPGAAGHFVKMVHNGIEYGLMELIAETYGLMKNGLGMADEAIGQEFAQVERRALAVVLARYYQGYFCLQRPRWRRHAAAQRHQGRGPRQGHRQVDLAGGDGLAGPDSDRGRGRVACATCRNTKTCACSWPQLYGPEAGHLKGDKNELLKQLEQAFYFSMIISYAQGMHLLAKASEEYKYDLQLATIAKIWRGGCIIRSAFLNEIYNAFDKDNSLAHLLLDDKVRELTQAAVPGMRAVVAAAVAAGQPRRPTPRRWATSMPSARRAYPRI
ncbi:MAG: hypothetical protein WKG07_21765 [Hymenobacter sp.]